MPYFQSTAGKVFYKIQGEGEPLLFIHGRTLDTRMWKPQIEYFKKKYRCITYDLNGFGKSEIPKDGYIRSETLKELLDYLNIHKCSFIALSLGVDVLIDFILIHPQYVNKMILLSGAVSGWDFSKEFLSDWREVINAAKESNFEKAKDIWLHCKAFRPLKENNLGNYALLEKIIYDYSGWDLSNAPKHNRTIHDAINHLAKIKVPTMIITGGKDYPDFIQIGEKMKREITNALIHSIPESGHMVNLEFPDKVNRQIESFLDKKSRI